MALINFFAEQNNARVAALKAMCRDCNLDADSCVICGIRMEIEEYTGETWVDIAG
jgi:hypothetical protein